MADYKELLRKAVEALPENNGAARRAVYEKARSALVAQLRGLNPPLPAREITQHRLQLEDCIRQVEQEASEAVISGLRGPEEVPQLAPPPAAEPESAASSAADSEELPPARHGRDLPSPPASRRAAPPPPPPSRRDAPKPASRLASKTKPAAASIEDIIAAADEEFPEEAPPARNANGRAAHAGNGAHEGPHLTMKARSAPEPEAEEAPAAEHERAGSEIELFTPPPSERRRVAHDEGVADRDDADEAEPDAPPPAARRGRNGAAPGPDAAGSGGGRALPSIVARAEAMRTGRGNSAAFGVPEARPFERERRGPVFEPRREMATSARAQAAARSAVPYSSEATAHKLHEVEVEPASSDPQSAIDRAIATLDREARGESVENEDFAADKVVELPAPKPADEGRKARRGAAEEVKPAPEPERVPPAAADRGFSRLPVDDDRSGGSAITIFLLIFLVLLIAACGGAFWAWREGYIDFAAMFGKPAAQTQSSAAPAAPPAGKPTASAEGAVANTTSTPDASQTPQAALKSADRLGGANGSSAASADDQVSPLASGSNAAETPTVPSATVTAETSAADSTEVKSEDRLTNSTQPGSGAAAGVAANPAAAAGNQSLLLEASDDGTTGAVPFSGTVEWSEGKDEMGRPTLVGKANIPARNLSVSVLIRKNSDPTLPASHLMEVNFKVPDSFIGGSIAGLPGVLLKNEELVQGSPLVGASARVVGNSFLFALSSSPDDVKANVSLLTSRKWMDLAIIYATGKRAIITLEKDDKAQALFTKVFDAWKQPPG